MKKATSIATGLMFSLPILTITSCFNKHQNDQEINNTQANNNSKPNIVLIMTDDQGWGDFSFTGNPVLETPHIDKFAKEAVYFEWFYVCPSCAATRASLLTGRYHFRTGTSWVTYRREAMRENEYTLPEMLKDHGYTTGCFGKWHNGAQFPHNANGQGFDEFVGFSAGHHCNYFDTKLEHNESSIETKGYITDVLTDYALDFINKNQNQPFFCYIPYNAPHNPYQVPDNYFNKYKAKGLDDSLACIYGMCENIDDNFARIIHQLDSLQLTENTIVLFLTDNGPHTWRFNGGMKGKKAHVDEGGVRVPLLMKWGEKYDKQIVVEELTAHIDILPTIADLIGIKLPDSLHIDGESFLAYITGDDVQKHRAICTNNTYNSRYPGAIRTSTYRLVLKDNDSLLYNIEKDLGQKNDISAEHTALTDSLAQLYHQWYDELTQQGLVPVPIHIGYNSHPKVVLPATDGALFGEVEFYGYWGWAHAWVSNWSTTYDTVSWSVKVVEAGSYQLGADLACQSDDIGTIVKVQAGKSVIQEVIKQPYEAAYIPSPDRVKRHEAYERKWQTMNLGKINLNEGTYCIKLSFSEISGKKSNIEFKNLIIKKID